MSHEGKDLELEKHANFVYDKISSKKKFLEELYADPGVLAKCSCDSPYILGFVECLNMFRPDVKVWTVGVFSSLGSVTLIVQDPDSIRSFLDKKLAEIKEKKPTPAKVIGKMLSLRLMKAVNVYKDTLESIQDSIYERWITQNEHRYSRYRAIQVAPNFSTMKMMDLREWLVLVKELSYYENQKIIEDILNFLERPELTEEIVRIACDMVVVGEVMDS